MKRTALLLTAVLAFAMAASAQSIEIGATMENFSLADVNGKTHSLNDLKGKNGAVVVFLSAQCPVVKAYHARINQIAADYAAKGINFIGINPNGTESLDWVKSDAEQVGYKFPMLIDAGAKVADKLGASVTPEVYFLDAKNTLLYHGAIDNDRSGKAITDRYLTAAFDLTLAGKKVEQTRKNAFGCSIKKAKAE